MKSTLFSGYISSSFLSCCIWTARFAWVSSCMRCFLRIFQTQIIMENMEYGWPVNSDFCRYLAHGTIGINLCGWLPDVELAFQWMKHLRCTQNLVCHSFSATQLSHFPSFLTVIKGSSCRRITPVTSRHRRLVSHVSTEKVSCEYQYGPIPVVSADTRYPIPVSF